MIIANIVAAIALTCVIGIAVTVIGERKKNP
jgi:hypothetical protein